MGFEDAMIAMCEEPELVHELLHYLSDFYIDVVAKTIDLYNPDTLCLMDDTASWSAPFISVDMYREFVLPHHEKFARYGRERGLPMTMHNCGKSEAFFDLLTGIGITAWDPAQTSNDLDAVKAKYGNRLVLMGGWDGRERLVEPLQSPEHPTGVTEEELRQSVRDSVDRLAPGGGYCWLGGFLTAVGDEENRKKNAIINDEASNYCKTFYQTH
jgi:uroporphyrinogen-III decarboxylase